MSDVKISDLPTLANSDVTGGDSVPIVDASARSTKRITVTELDKRYVAADAPVPVASGGTGAANAASARANLGAAESGANSDILSLSGLTTPLSVGQGGTGGATQADARAGIGAAKSGTNTDITSLDGPALGEPASGDLRNCTNVPNSATTATSAATASAIVARDANANAAINNLNEAFATTATAGGTTTLTAASAPLQQFTGTTTQTVALPSATTIPAGCQFFIFNRSTGALTIKDGGSNTIAMVSGGGQACFTCSATGSAAGSWDQTITYTGTLPVALGGTGTTTSTGSGSAVLSTSPTLTAPTQASYEDFTEISTPATPGAGVLRVYAKGGDVLATKNSAGTESIVGSGSGQKNYLQASSSTAAGWTAYGTVAATTDTTAADLPRAITTQTGWKLTPSGSASGTFTVTVATPAVFTASAHGMQTGYVVTFSTTGALPTGLTAGTAYYVNVVSSSTFNVATTMANLVAGTYVATTGTQSGTHSFTFGGAYLRFTADKADYTVTSAILFAQNILSGATGDWEVDLYQNTASDYSGTYTRLYFRSDTNGSSILANAEYTSKFYFDMPNSTAPYLELRFNKVAANTHALVGSDLIVGPGTSPQSAAVTGPTSWTPTFSSLGTVTNISTFYTRVGSKLKGWGTFKTGTGSAALAKMSLPSGLTINSAYHVQSQNVLGYGTDNASSAQGVLVQGAGVAIIYDSSDATSVFFALNTDTTTNDKAITAANATSIFNNSSRFVFNFEVEINEWAGNGTVALAQNDVQYYYGTGGTWGTSSTLTTAQGPGGVLGGTTTPSGTSFAYTIVPTTPIPVGVTPVLKTSLDGIHWSQGTNSAAGNIVEALRDDGTNYVGAGAYLDSSGNILVRFGKYSAGTSTAWGGTWYWRVDVGLPGQAVGFGAVSANASGLMPSTNTNLDDGAATRLGLKQYLSSGSYNGGLAPTISGTTVTRGVFVPYQTNDGTWRLKMNVVLAVSSGTRTSGAFTVAGVTFKNVSGFSQPVFGFPNPSTVATYQAYATANSGVVEMDHASATTTGYLWSGDVELDSKPTWAY